MLKLYGYTFILIIPPGMAIKNRLASCKANQMTSGWFDAFLVCLLIERTKALWQRDTALYLDTGARWFEQLFKYTNNHCIDVNFPSLLIWSILTQHYGFGQLCLRSGFSCAPPDGSDLLSMLYAFFLWCLLVGAVFSCYFFGGVDDFVFHLVAWWLIIRYILSRRFPFHFIWSSASLDTTQFATRQNGKLIYCPLRKTMAQTESWNAASNTFCVQDVPREIRYFFVTGRVFQTRSELMCGTLCV